jgi:hypothetical protein
MLDLSRIVPAVMVATVDKTKASAMLANKLASWSKREDVAKEDV